MKKIYLAGGCFWGIQKYFDNLCGVHDTTVGYANGKTQNPTYKEVCNASGHAECIQINYDPSALPLSVLLDFFFDCIDPVAINHQGGDRGIQYRTGIYYTDPTDLPTLQQKLAELQQKHTQPIAIECLPLQHFFDAEEYHQKYLDKNAGGYCHISKQKFENAKNYQPKNNQ